MASIPDSVLPQARKDDDPARHLHQPDLQLSSSGDGELDSHELTALGHDYSRAMQIHARRLRLGHALLFPSVYKTPPAPLRSDCATIGDVGLLHEGTFKPLWSTWLSGHAGWGSQPRYKRAMKEHLVYEYSLDVHSWNIEDTHPQALEALEARLSSGRENDGRDVYARLEWEKGHGLQLVKCRPDMDLLMFMYGCYDEWQTMASELQDHDEYKGLTGPMELVMCTGGISALQWNIVVGDGMQKGVEYDPAKTPEQNGLKRRVVNIGKTDKDTERAWVSIRFNKCLSRKVYEARGKVDKERRSVVDDVLEYILDSCQCVDVAVTGHDDIDRFMHEASQRPEYQGLITPNTTYDQFVSMLGKIIFPYVDSFDDNIPRRDFGVMNRPLRKIGGRLFSKTRVVGLLESNF